MARKWMAKAFADSKKGVFKAKAERAGKSTREFAEEHKGGSGKTAAQARLALAGMNAKHGGKSRGERWYGSS